MPPGIKRGTQRAFRQQLLAKVSDDPIIPTSSLSLRHGLTLPIVEHADCTASRADGDPCGNRPTQVLGGQNFCGRHLNAVLGAAFRLADESYVARLNEQRRDGWTYVVLRDGRAKIGFSQYAAGRVRGLTVLLMRGGRALESELHDRFDRERDPQPDSTEWFQMSARLRRYLARQYVLANRNEEAVT